MSNFVPIAQKMRPLEDRKEKHKTGSGAKSSRTICPKKVEFVRGTLTNLWAKFKKIVFGKNYKVVFENFCAKTGCAI